MDSVAESIDADLRSVVALLSVAAAAELLIVPAVVLNVIAGTIAIAVVE